VDEKKTSVLVVEDDGAVRNLIVTALKSHGYAPHAAVTGKKALAAIATSAPDIVLLDLGLPDVDGVEVIAKVRTWSQVPIIVVSARSDDLDKISALDAGADDYLSKPFSVGELLARIRTTERHLSYMVHEEPHESVFENGDLQIDFVAGTVCLAGKDLHLPPREYRLLCLLARNVGRVLTHQFILREAWSGGQEGDLASLRVFMGSLRKKIGTQYIQTHVGVGYRMVRV
jgi:two-component system KDP operon response regulator KdpE